MSAQNMDPYDRNFEKHPVDAEIGNVSNEKASSFAEQDDAIVSGEVFGYGSSPFAKLQRLAGKLKIEQRGIERVPDSERTDNEHPYLNIGTIVSGRSALIRKFCLTADNLSSGYPLTWLYRPLLSAFWASRSSTWALSMPY